MNEMSTSHSNHGTVMATPDRATGSEEPDGVEHIDLADDWPEDE